MVIFSVSPAFGRNSCTLSAIARTILTPSIWMAIGNDRDPVNPSSTAWRGNTLIVLGGAHELHVTDTECRRLVEAYDPRIPAPLLEAADVLLTEPRELRKLLLCQAFFLPDPFDVPPDQLAHVHAAEVSDRSQLPSRWMVKDGTAMADNVHELQSKVGET